MRSDVSLHGTVGVEGDAGAPGTSVDGTEDAQAAEHDVQQITAAFAQLLEHMLLRASSAHVIAEFPVFVFSCWSSSVQEAAPDDGWHAFLSDGLHLSPEVPIQKYITAGPSVRVS